MRDYALIILSALICIIATQAMAQDPPDPVTTGAFQNHSGIEQNNLGFTSALINQDADKGSRNDSFVTQIGTTGSAGTKQAQITQNGTNNKNYSYVRQSEGGPSSIAFVNQGGTGNESWSRLEQRGMGSNIATVNQGLIGSNSSHRSTIYQNSEAGYLNTATVTQVGRLGTDNSSLIDQSGSNSAMVTQGSNVVSGVMNDSSIMQTDSNSATVLQGTYTSAESLVNISTIVQSGGGGIAIVVQN